MVKTALNIGANTFAFFTRNPRGSKAKPEDAVDAAKAVAMMGEKHFGPLVAHGAYTMNLCTGDPEARAFAAEVLEDDLRRMAALPGNFYNFHPGSHVGQGTEAGIEFISAALKMSCADKSTSGSICLPTWCSILILICLVPFITPVLACLSSVQGLTPVSMWRVFFLKISWQKKMMLQKFSILT